jgi:hypothetical protein
MPSLHIFTIFQYTKPHYEAKNGANRFCEMTQQLRIIVNGQLLVTVHIVSPSQFLPCVLPLRKPRPDRLGLSLVTKVSVPKAFHLSLIA